MYFFDKRIAVEKPFLLESYADIRFRSQTVSKNKKGEIQRNGSHGSRCAVFPLFYSAEGAAVMIRSGLNALAILSHGTSLKFWLPVPSEVRLESS